jgi:putative transposase
MAGERVYYHVVLTVMHGKPVFLNAEVDAAFKELVREIARQGQWTLIELETMPNHVHVLLEKAPWQDLRRIVKALKAFTARRLFAQFGWLREELGPVHFWVRGHHYVCHDDASLATVRAYVRNQRRAGGLAD